MSLSAREMTWARPDRCAAVPVHSRRSGLVRLLEHQYDMSMSELAAPLPRSARALLRLQRLEDTQALIARLQSQVRLELVALLREDTPVEQQRFLSDELAIAFAESPGSAQRMLTTAQLYSEHPAVAARVGLPLADGGWSMRHADAVLDEIVGLGLTPAAQQQAVALVVAHPDARTPHQVRKAARAAVLVVDPASAERRYAKARKDRRVLSEDLGTGAAFFGATGTTSQIAMVMASIDALAGPRQPGDARTLDQRRFDAFMDLICGRAVPKQWQALVVVPLSVLEGGDEPAEVPGFGLISAGEARDVLASAELRRAVVDDDGHLVSLDSTVHRPDLPDVVPLTEPDPDLLLSGETEPALLDTSPEDEVDDEDRQWALRADLAGDAEGSTQADVEAAVRELTSELESALAALLDSELLTAGSPSPASLHRPEALVEIGSWRHLPPPDAWGDGPGAPPPPHDPSGGTGVGPGEASPESGSSPPRSSEDEPCPPSWEDLAWYDATLDRAAQDAQEPPPRYEREPGAPPRPAPPTTGWTRTALDAAHARLRSAPVDRAPLTSTAYALPPRLARHVKHRDIRRNLGSHATPWSAAWVVSISLRSSAGVRKPCRLRGRALSSAAMLSRRPGP